MLKKGIKTVSVLLAAVLAMGLLLTACTGAEKAPAPAPSSGSGAVSGSAVQTAPEAEEDEAEASARTGVKAAPEIAGLKLESEMDPQFATEFEVYYYSDGFKVLSISDGRQYLLVPEGKEAPEGAEGSLVILQAPLDRCYLAATSAMSLLLAIGAQDNIKMAGTNASGWYIPEAKAMLEDGRIIYAGKYSEPDYEMMIDQDCDIAIESTMILHSPKVQEMIEKMDIPVFIDRASYETHPLGRTEWIRLYGAMFDKEKEAEAIFEEKAQIVKEMEDFPNTEKTVAYFNVKKDGTVQIRNPHDYIATMIDLGGARYIFRDLQVPTDSTSTLSISMEEFYATAVDADYLVYNATIADPITSIEDLIGLNELFADFKAVKEGNVWLGGNNMYQATDIIADFILDVNKMVTGGSEADMVFLKKVN